MLSVREFPSIMKNFSHVMRNLVAYLAIFSLFFLFNLSRINQYKNLVYNAKPLKTIIAFKNSLIHLEHISSSQVQNQKHSFYIFFEAKDGNSSPIEILFKNKIEKEELQFRNPHTLQTRSVNSNNPYQLFRQLLSLQNHKFPLFKSPVS